MTSVSWAAPNDLDLTEWLKQGHRIGMMGRSAGWWIGDWLRFGNAKYGEKYTQAKKITGYDVQTLMNMVWVASQIDVSRRREDLSWSHHMEVVAEDLPTQERLLDKAAAERLSVRNLRALIRLERNADPDRDGVSQPPPGERVVCPRFVDARREGAQLTVDEAVAWTRRGRGSRKRPPAGWESLTPTELEVARHAAAGLTNLQIATATFTSPSTVKTHMSHIYAKLGVHNRARLTAEVIRHLPPGQP